MSSNPPDIRRLLTIYAEWRKKAITPPVNLDKASLPPEEEVILVHDSVPFSNPFQALGEWADAPISGMDVNNASLKRRTSESCDCSYRSR